MLEREAQRTSSFQLRDASVAGDGLQPGVVLDGETLGRFLYPDP